MAFQVKKFNSIVASMINWISSATDKITDFNPGSVVRTIIEAVAMELEELYYQLLVAVEEAIDEAIYRTFNFPRNPPRKATGEVRFYRLLGNEDYLFIPKGALVSTDTSPPVVFETVEDGRMPMIEGLATGGSTTTLIDTTKNFVEYGVVVGSKVKNLTRGVETGESGVLSIQTTTNPNDTLVFAAVGAAFSSGDAYKVMVPFTDIVVQAMEAGSIGNVSAGSIILLKTSVAGIGRVENLQPTGGGIEEESDISRKARFALYIQSLSRATRGALEYAARSIEQIVAAKAIDDVRPTVLIYSNYGNSWTDITTEMRNPGDKSVRLFPFPNAAGDILYIGAKEVFDYINFHLFINGVIETNQTEWEYWNGSNWIQLSVTDGTNGGTGPLTRSGTVSWTVPSDWLATTVNGMLRMWIRLRLLADNVYSTVPEGNFCSLPPGLGYVDLYCHDGAGELSTPLKNAVESIVELYRGCGIIVKVKSPSKIMVNINVQIIVAENYDADDLANRTKLTILDFVNKKVLGSDLYISELYHLIMGINEKAILNCFIYAPVKDIIVPSSALVRTDSNRVTVSAVRI